MSSKAEQQQDPRLQDRPTSAELFTALREGGKEKLRELLSQIEDSVEIVIAPSVWKAMTEDEQKRCLHELIQTRKRFIVDRVKWECDSNPTAISTFW
jgi:hypothetical protein